jgi:hypothetical protein
LVALEMRRSVLSPGLTANGGRLLERIHRLAGKPANAGANGNLGKGLAAVMMLTVIGIPGVIAILSSADKNIARASDDVVTKTAPANFEEAGVSNSDTTASKKVGDKAEERRSVRIVAGPKGDVWFEGKKTSWDEIVGLLEAVPNRESTVLEVAIASDELSVREMNDAIAKAGIFANQFKFKYSSYIGVHPIKPEGNSLLDAREILG